MNKSDERKMLIRFNKAIWGPLGTVEYYPEEQRAKPEFESLIKAWRNIDWDNMGISGLREMANDAVEAHQGYSGNALQVIDETLEKAGIVTLSDMRDRGYRRALQLLSMKKINKEEDVYLLKSYVDNLDERFSEEQLDYAERLIEAYAANA